MIWTAKLLGPSAKMWHNDNNIPGRIGPLFKKASPFRPNRRYLSRHRSVMPIPFRTAFTIGFRTTNSTTMSITVMTSSIALDIWVLHIGPASSPPSVSISLRFLFFRPGIEIFSACPQAAENNKPDMTARILFPNGKEDCSCHLEEVLFGVCGKRPYCFHSLQLYFLNTCVLEWDVSEWVMGF